MVFFIFIWKLAWYSHHQFQSVLLVNVFVQFTTIPYLSKMIPICNLSVSQIKSNELNRHRTQNRNPASAHSNLWPTTHSLLRSHFHYYLIHIVLWLSFSAFNSLCFARTCLKYTGPLCRMRFFILLLSPRWCACVYWGRELPYQQTRTVLVRIGIL